MTANIRKFLTGLLLFQGSFVSGFSQTAPKEFPADSIKAVMLTEVQVSGLRKGSRQQLFDFFRANNAATLEETIGRLPEINLVRRGSFGMEPAIRTYKDAQINVLIDGMRIHGACTDKMDPVTIYVEPINLEKLELRTASQGFLEGSSLGGTINFRLAVPDTSIKQKITGVFNSGFQSAANGIYESVALNYAVNKWAFRASGTYRKSENYRSGAGHRIPFSGFQKFNTTFATRYQISAQTALRMDVLFDEGWNIGYAALPMDVGYAAAKIFSATIDHQAAFRNKISWQFKLYGNSIRHFMDDSRRPNVPMHMDMPGYSKTFGMHYGGNFQRGEKQRIQFVIDAARTDLRASMTMYEANQLPMFMLTWPDNSKWQAGAGINWIYKLDSATQIQTNARIDAINYRLSTAEAKDQIAVFGYPVTPLNKILVGSAVQISRSISRKWTSSLSLSYGQRMPGAGELYGIYLFNSNDGYDYIGNAALKVEKSIQTEAAINYAFRKNRMRLSLSYGTIHDFIKGIHDPTLSAMTIGANGVKRYINIEKASVFSAEFSSQVMLLKEMVWINTLRFNYASDENGKPLPQIAPLKYIGSLRYGFGHFSAGLEWEHAVRQDRIDVNSGEDKTDSYSLLHIRGGYQFFLGRVRNEIQVGCENLFDTQYHEHLDWGNISRPGRNLYVTYKVVF